MKALYLSAVFCVLLGYVAAIPKYYMDQHCGGMITVDKNIRLKLTSRSSYKKNMDCTLILKISSLSLGTRFMLYFNNLDTETDCSNDYLEIRDGQSSSSSYVNGFYGKQCGDYISNSVQTTTGQYLFLHFVSDSSLQYSGFDMVITNYHKGVCDGDEYRCDNGRCISDSITCDGYNPCGDYSDYRGCALSGGTIAGIVSGSLFTAIFIIAVVAVFCRARRIGYTGRRTNIAVVGGQNMNTGYSQPVPAQYPAPAYPGNPQPYPTGQAYPSGQQYPPPYTS